MSAPPPVDRNPASLIFVLDRTEEARPDALIHLLFSEIKQRLDRARLEIQELEFLGGPILFGLVCYPSENPLLASSLAGAARHRFDSGHGSTLAEAFSAAQAMIQGSSGGAATRTHTVIHVTMAKECAPAALEAAQQLLSLPSDCRPVMLFHAHVTDDWFAPNVCYPRTESEIPAGPARDLFQISSDLRGSRGLVWNAKLADFREFLERVLPFESARSPDSLSLPTAAPTASRPAEPTASLHADVPVVPSKPPSVDENVQFTTYCPKQVAPETYATVLAFAHLEELRPDAADDEPDPVEEVKRQARNVLGDAVDSYRSTTQESQLAIPREGELTFTLEIDGFRCNPPRHTISWEESVHRVEFRVKAPASLHGTTCRGQLRVFLGDLLLAETTLRILVTSQAERTRSAPIQRHEMKRYRKIFASYSRRDLAIVQQFERFAATMGDEYLRDLVDLRSGENWNDGLKRLIEEADVFQLFWSRNSMQSPFVRDEWMYALSLNRPNFIRPMYWEQPFPEVPPQLPPQPLRDLHFKLLGRFVPNAPASEATETSSGDPELNDDEAACEPLETGTKASLPDVAAPTTSRQPEPPPRSGRGDLAMRGGDDDEIPLGNWPRSEQDRIRDIMLRGGSASETEPENRGDFGMWGGTPNAEIPKWGATPTTFDKRDIFERTDLNIRFPQAPANTPPKSPTAKWIAIGIAIVVGIVGFLAWRMVR